MKVKVIKMANTNKRYEPEFKKRWSGRYQKKDEPSQASIKSITQEKELSGAGSDSLKNPETKDIYEENRRLRKKLEEAEKEVRFLKKQPHSSQRKSIRAIPIY